MSFKFPTPKTTATPGTDVVSDPNHIIWEDLLRKAFSLDRTTIEEGYSSLQRSLKNAIQGLESLSQEILQGSPDDRGSKIDDFSHRIQDFLQTISDSKNSEKRLWHPNGYVVAEMQGIARNPKLIIAARRFKIRKQLLRIDPKEKIDLFNREARYADALIRLCHLSLSKDVSSVGSIATLSDPAIIEAILSALS
jgi:hypothetical protein